MAAVTSARVFTPLMAVLLVAPPRLECAGKTDIRAAWNDLSSLTAGQKIAIVLPDGAHLKGRVLQVESDHLLLDVAKTSDPNAYPKGRTFLPRASVRSFTMTRSGTRWKVIGTAIGFGAGLAIAVPVNAYAHNEGDGAPAAVAALIAVPAALGLLAGWSADRKTVTVSIQD